MQEAKKQGLEVVLYDDYSFPSGTAGGLLYSKFPQYVAKSLDMTEQDVTGPKRIDLAIPQGIYMGSVLMNRDTHELVDVSGRGKAGHLIAPGAEGQLEGDGLLSRRRQRDGGGLSGPGAMTAYISLTYDRYNQYLGKYFGNIITQTFYDEPSMHHSDRIWTPDFNAAFQKKLRLFTDEVLSSAVVRHRPANRRRARCSVRLPRHAVSRRTTSSG